MKRYPTIDVNSTSLYYIRHSLTLTWINDPDPYDSWVNGLAQPAVSDTMSVLSKQFGDSIQQSQYNYCLLTSSFPSSDKLFLLMMDTMMFLSNPLVTTILHCKPTLLLLLLCISIFVGHALCIQTTFIVPHPWKYLISIFFLFILGAAARLTTNCKNYFVPTEAVSYNDDQSSPIADKIQNNLLRNHN